MGKFYEEARKMGAASFVRPNGRASHDLVTIGGVPIMRIDDAKGHIKLLVSCAKMFQKNMKVIESYGKGTVAF